MRLGKRVVKLFGAIADRESQVAGIGEDGSGIAEPLLAKSLSYCFSRTAFSSKFSDIWKQKRVPHRSLPLAEIAPFTSRLDEGADRFLHGHPRS